MSNMSRTLQPFFNHSSHSHVFFSEKSNDFARWSTLAHLQLITIIVVSLALVTRYIRPTKHGRTLPGPLGIFDHTHAVSSRSWHYTGIPWAGPIWAFEDKIYETFTAWSEKFGSIYQVDIFGTNFIVLSDPRMAKDILSTNANVASDRPPVAVVHGSKTSGKYLPFLGNNGKI